MGEYTTDTVIISKKLEICTSEMIKLEISRICFILFNFLSKFTPKNLRFGLKKTEALVEGVNFFFDW